MESLSTNTSFLSQHAKLVHLAIFLAMELLYFVLAAICWAVHRLVIPGFAYDHESEGYLKGGFTILFVLWQSFAILPVHVIVNYMFSTEWAFQFRASVKPRGGVTD